MGIHVSRMGSNEMRRVNLLAEAEDKHYTPFVDGKRNDRNTAHMENDCNAGMKGC